MSFKSITILFSLATSICVHASTTLRLELSSVKQYPGYRAIEVFAAEVGNGTIVAYQPESNAVSQPSIGKRDAQCGSNAPVRCDNKNEAPVWLCHNLMNSFNAFSSRRTGGNLSLCMTKGEDSCCVGWTEIAPGSSWNVGALVPALEVALNAKCRPNSDRISAVVANVVLGGYPNCGFQCVSDRPGCAD